MVDLARQAFRGPANSKPATGLRIPFTGSDQGAHGVGPYKTASAGRETGVSSPGESQAVGSASTSSSTTNVSTTVWASRTCSNPITSETSYS